MPRRAVPVTLALVVLAGPASSQSPLGPEFQINTFTTHAQRRPAVAADAAGNFVVVWDSRDQDGSLYGVFARRHDASGNPLGVTEFQVNSFTTGNQLFPQVASDPAGRLVVVWSSLDADGYGIFGRQFDAVGGAGPEFPVNTFTTGRQYRPSVSSDAAGNFIAVWHSDGQDGSEYGVYAQRFSAAGQAHGAEFRVNSYTTGRQRDPSVAMDPSGNFVVVWADDRQCRGYGCGYDYEIFAQLYDAAGTPAGAEFQVNTYTKGRQGEPQVASDADGNFVVVWTSAAQDGYGSGHGTGVAGRRYDASGTARGDEFPVNSFTFFGQFSPDVSSDPDGKFVVVWTSGVDGSGWGSFGQMYDALGVPIANEFRVNTHTAYNQGYPSVASDGAGNFVTVWESQNGQDGSYSGIFGRRFSMEVIFKDGFETGAP